MPQKKTLSVKLFLVAALGSLLFSCTRFTEGGGQVKQYWDKTVTRCGSFYFGQVSPNKGIAEYKDFDYTLQESAISEADKLNGVEWRGITRAKSGAYRYFWTRWTNWAEGSPGEFGVFPPVAFPPVSPEVEVSKINGRWYYGGVDASNYNPKPVNCNEMPKN